jgi:hypothetical protein
LASGKIEGKLHLMTMKNLAPKKPNQGRTNLAKKNKTAISLIDSWLEAEEKEQKETFEYLKKVLDEDRLSERKLFE